MPENNVIEFEVQAQQTQSPIQLGVSGGSGNVGLDATMINDIMVGLIERCVAHQYDPNYYYYKYDYVIYQHRLWQYITDHVPGDFNEAEVRLMTLADDVKLLYDTLIRETVFVGSSEWSHTSNYYKKKISGKYQPGKKLYISTPCENPEAYIAITYHRDFPVPIGGMSASFTEEEHPNGDLNGYSFILYDGTDSNIIDYYTIKAYGFTEEEIANTYIYSRDIKNDLIADEFSNTKTYKVGEYSVHLGELVRFIGKNHSAGNFSPDLAENVTVGEELTTLFKLFCNAFEITVFPIATTTPYTTLEYDKLYWEPGLDYFIMWPSDPVDPDDPDPPTGSFIFISTSETGTDENGNTVYIHKDIASMANDAEHISIWEYLQSKFSSANENASTRIPLSQKGAANGVAELDSNGLIPAAQLPLGLSIDSSGYICQTV